MKKKRDGLYKKFKVERNDQRDAEGEKHRLCNYFVIDITHDPHARPALLAYAKSCEEQLPRLAEDLREVFHLVSASVRFGRILGKSDDTGSK